MSSNASSTGGGGGGGGHEPSKEEPKRYLPEEEYHRRIAEHMAALGECSTNIQYFLRQELIKMNIAALQRDLTELRAMRLKEAAKKEGKNVSMETIVKYDGATATSKDGGSFVIVVLLTYLMTIPCRICDKLWAKHLAGLRHTWECGIYKKWSDQPMVNEDAEDFLATRENPLTCETCINRPCQPGDCTHFEVYGFTNVVVSTEVGENLRPAVCFNTNTNNIEEVTKLIPIAIAAVRANEHQEVRLSE